MSTILNAFKEAFLLIVRFNPDFYRVLSLSLIVSGTATVIGAVIGIPLGVALSESSFHGKRALLILLFAFMGLPPVVVGLFTFLLLAKSGPLGSLDLIYTPTAMVIVQVILATPIIAGLTHVSLGRVDPRLGLQAMSLGATRRQVAWVKMREVRAGLVAAVIAGLGRVMAEVGGVMIVGGNIKGQTRVLTTDIVLQTRMGNYQLALAEGIVLILLVVIIIVVISNIFLTKLQTEKGRRGTGKRVTEYPA